MNAVVYAGGGTGGHIFPALAVAEQVSALAPGAPPDARFLCSSRPLDADILRQAGVAFHAIPAQPFSLRPAGLLRFVRSWPSSVAAASGVLRDAALRGPVVLVTTGGFVAAPAVRAACRARVPILMLNLDAVPGRANRWIARRAGRVLTTATSPHTPEAWERIPPIVRRDGLPPADAPECRRRLGLDPARPVLLVTGASQAQSINRMMIELVRRHGPAWRAAGWQVLHQTGRSDTDECRAAYAEAGIPAVVEPFVRAMGEWWGAAEVCVGRCGAGIVAEAWAARVPAVFMPYPYHTDEHQKHNAAPLVSCGGAVLSTDHIDPSANADAAGRQIARLLADSDERARRRAALAVLGPADGAARAARRVLEALELDVPKFRRDEETT